MPLTKAQRVVPDWLAEMEFCHLDDGSGLHAFCLSPDGDGPITCDGEWDSRAICEACGLPVCPRCVQLGALADELSR